MRKLITFALVGIAGVSFAASLSRVQTSTFKTSQTRVLNNVISEAETAITANEFTQTTVSLTNGATLTATADSYVVSGIEGADDSTNTITLANATDGQLLTIIIASDSTNLIQIADSGNASLSGAWVGDNYDVITLVGVSTQWVEKAASDN